MLSVLSDISSLFSNNLFKWVQKFLAIERLELSTLALLARCSNRLSYTALLSVLSGIWSLFSNNFSKWVQNFLAIERLGLAKRSF